MSRYRVTYTKWAEGYCYEITERASGNAVAEGQSYGTRADAARCARESMRELAERASTEAVAS